MEVVKIVAPGRTWARAGGFGGRVCSCCCLRRSAPHLRFRKHANSWSTRSWNGGHSRASELPTHTRPPTPPAHGDRRPKRYHSAHSDLEVFITPGFGGACVGDAESRLSAPQAEALTNHVIEHFFRRRWGAMKRKRAAPAHAPPHPLGLPTFSRCRGCPGSAGGLLKFFGCRDMVRTFTIEAG